MGKTVVDKWKIDERDRIRTELTRILQPLPFDPSVEAAIDLILAERQDGYNEGWSEGWDDGNSEGYDDGYENGRGDNADLRVQVPCVRRPRRDRRADVRDQRSHSAVH